MAIQKINVYIKCYREDTAYVAWHTHTHMYYAFVGVGIMCVCVSHLLAWICVMLKLGFLPEGLRIIMRASNKVGGVHLCGHTICSKMLMFVAAIVARATMRQIYVLDNTQATECIGGFMF